MRPSFRRKVQLFIAYAALLSTGLASFALPAQALDRIPNDAYFSEQWYLRQIGAPAAWNRTLGLETVTIAMIDSGVDIDHPDLKDNIWTNTKEIAGNGVDDDNNGYVDDVHGWNFVDNNNDPRPSAKGAYDALDVNHGTIDAGVAAARGGNGIGIAGVAWQSAIMPLRVLDSQGQAPSYRIAQAVEYAVKNGARVINLSFAGPNYSDVLAIALKRAYEAGVFIVAAAGNAPDGGKPVDLGAAPLYPICLDQGDPENFIFGVASTNEADRLAPFSNYGAGCVDATAPGTHIVSTQYYNPLLPDFKKPYGGYFNGTSVSAPIVAGLAALLISLDKNLTPAQITRIILDTSDPIDARNPETAGKIGRGRINAAAAVAAVVKMTNSAPTDQGAGTLSLLPAGAKRVFVTASGPGRAAEVRLFTEDGIFVKGFPAFPASFKGGASLAIGNFNGDRRSSIVVGALAGGSPQVRIFNLNGSPIGGFLAFDPKFRGGVQVATGDIDGDGRDEIVVGAGPGGGPQIRIFDSDGSPAGSFFAFDPKFRGGVQVATGDIDGDGRTEIIAASGPGTLAGRRYPTTVSVFSSHGVLKSEFRPFGSRYYGGASVAAADTNNDGTAEIVVGALAASRTTALALFNGSGVPIRSASLAGYRGFRVAGAVGGTPRLFAAGVSGSAPSVAAFPASESAPSAFQFLAYEPKFKGGLSMGIMEIGTP